MIMYVGLSLNQFDSSSSIRPNNMTHSKLFLFLNETKHLDQLKMHHSTIPLCCSRFGFKWFVVLVKYIEDLAYICLQSLDLSL